MRKMTKTAVTLAAMSAMTVATASMAFAAEKQEPNISSIAREEEAVNTSAVGEWSGDDVKGWSFTKEGNIKLKDQWAQIDGVWYYFIGDKIAQNRFLTLDDKGYFFDETGRLATGWQKITSKMDAYSDVNIADELYNPTANGYTQVDPNHEYDYHDFVWCYFDESGIAKENEWFQSPESGLWYFFDGNVMVKGIYDYRVNPDNYDEANSDADRLYGFDSNGAMLVGWNSKDAGTTWNNPTADSKGKVWYYYKTNGQMQKAGWMKLDGNWYLFADLNVDNPKPNKGGYPLIVNSYVRSSNGEEYEYFYVNEKGELVSGIQTIEDFYRVTFYTDNTKKVIETNWETGMVKDTPITINFSGKSYAAKEGVEGNRYFNLENKNIVDVYGYLNTVDGTKYIYDMVPTANDANPIFDNNQIKGTEWKFSISDINIKDLDAIPYYWTQGLNKEKKIENVIFLKNTATNKTLVDNAKAAKESYKNAEKTHSEVEKTYNKAEAEWVEAQGKLEVSERVISVSVTGYTNTSWTAADLGYTEEIMPDVPGSEPVTPSAARITRANDTLDIISLEKALTERLASSEDENEIKKIEDALKDVRSAREEIEKQIAGAAGFDMKEYQKALNDLRDAEELLNNTKNNLIAKEELIRALENTEDNVTNTVNSEDLTDEEGYFTVKGELVTSAFIGYKDNLYLADKNGNFITNKAVLFSQSGNYEGYDNLYILFGSDGRAIKGYEGKNKTVVVGGISYWSTNRTVTLGEGDDKVEVTVFVSNRMTKGKK